MRNDRIQVIFFGAPGTGKSYGVAKMLDGVPSDHIFRVTIYPEFNYSDFVGQLLPQEKNGSVEFKFHKGPFVEALEKAFEDSSKNVYLVIEEISRGNITAIFGDLFQLLDRDELFKSQFKIRNKQISDCIDELSSDEGVYLPSNFNIICTVNTNDQSVYPMDTAFKRRFDWIYVSTKPQKLNKSDTTFKLNNPKMRVHSDSLGEIETNWVSFYSALNSFITNKYTGLGMKEAKQVGRFFIKFPQSVVDGAHSANSNDLSNALDEVDALIKNKLLIYLWQDVQPYNPFDSEMSLFAKSISDFDALYDGYGKGQVFSDEFISQLSSAKDKYPF